MTLQTRVTTTIAILFVAVALSSCTGMMACSLRGTCGTTGSVVPDAGTTKSITDEGEDYSIDVQYPVTADAAVNEKLSGLVDAEMRSFRSQAANGSPSTAWKNTLVIRFEVPDAPDGLFSIVFHSYIYTGGAHGMTHVITRNYETPGGRQLTLDDLFRPKSDYLPVLSDIAVSELRSKLGESADTDWIKRGTAPDHANFERFTLTRDAVVFHFEAYTVAPYAAGIQTVTVQRTDIAGLLRS
jgi:hypothetical protein